MSVSAPEFTAGPTISEQVSLVTGFLRRRYLIIVICVLLSSAMGALFLYAAPPMYTASATMMIETQKDSVLRLGASDGPLDAAWIASQIEILKSQDVAAYVVKQLHLADDPEFPKSGAGLWEKILDRLGWGPRAPASDAERFAVATGVLMGQLATQRIGPSYLIQISFRSHNQEQATKIANAVIDGYIFDQLNAKYQANRRASDWLQERLQALREQAATAERAVIEFKAKNNIIAASGGSLMNEKQLSEATSQLATTRDHVADVQARLNRIDAIRRAFQTDLPTGADETISDEMSNPIIGGLRGKYLDLVNKEAEWSVKYGANHIAVVNLRNQIRDIRKSIFDELGRIQESYRSDYAIAKQRQDEMEKGLAGLISQSQDTNQAQVTLFSLEAAAKSYRKLYDDFLQRHTETVQAQSYPISDARSVSSAFAYQTYPKPSLVWLMAICAGGMLGVGLGVLREFLDHGFRTREQVRSAIAIDCLALVPLLQPVKKPRRRLQSVAAATLPRQSSPQKIYSAEELDAATRRADIPTRAAGFVAPRAITGAPAAPRSARSDREISRIVRSDRRILWAAADAPLSHYADAIRSIKMTIDLDSKASPTPSTRVIGLTSCLPGEGKTTVATGVATLIAQSGARVVLIDCDIRNPSLTRALAPNASVGLLDIIAGRASFAEAVWNDPATNMTFLPMVVNSRLGNPADLLTSDAAQAFLSTLRIRYDYVIVDLAPLVSVVDIQATSRLIESYLLVINWGDTKPDVVRYTLRNVPGVQENIIGAVLNKVDMDALRRYDGYGAHYYYGRGHTDRLN
jgi:succinoglycan biosynthesis transport protein ExoP